MGNDATVGHQQINQRDVWRVRFAERGGVSTTATLSNDPDVVLGRQESANTVTTPFRCFRRLASDGAFDLRWIWKSTAPSPRRPQSSND